MLLFEGKPLQEQPVTFNNAANQVEPVSMHHVPRTSSIAQSEATAAVIAHSLTLRLQANKSSIIQGPQKKYPPVSGKDALLTLSYRNMWSAGLQAQQP